jgi:hypothetical protein
MLNRCDICDGLKIPRTPKQAKLGGGKLERGEEIAVNVIPTGIRRGRQ